MREPKIYLTKKVKRNLELKERIEKYGSKSVKCLPKKTKSQIRKAEKLKRKEEARKLKAAKREARNKKRAERKAQEKGV